MGSEPLCQKLPRSGAQEDDDSQRRFRGISEALQRHSLSIFAASRRGPSEALQREAFQRGFRGFSTVAAIHRRDVSDKWPALREEINTLQEENNGRQSETSRRWRAATTEKPLQRL